MVWRTRVLISAVLASLLVLSGCAAELKTSRILWPPPPEKPRLEFIGVLASEQDFPKSAGEKLLGRIGGEAPKSIFESPFGIASNGKGVVYVSDLHGRNVQVFNFQKRTVEPFPGNSEIMQPLGLDLDEEGNLYVADAGRGVVLVFSPAGTLLRTISTPDIVQSPAYVAINQKLGRLYVSDGRDHKIVVFDLQGKELLRFGKFGKGDGEFYSPQGMAIDAQNRVFVADFLNARIQVFDADGQFIRMFGQRGDRFYDFEAPKDLAFDGSGNLFVVDNRRSAIYTYTPEGEVLLVTGSDKRSSHPLGFSTPTGIHVDTQDRIYVTDMLNRRFSVWQYLSDAYLEKHPITEADLAAIEDLRKRSKGKQ